MRESQDSENRFRFWSSVVHAFGAFKGRKKREKLFFTFQRPLFRKNPCGCDIFRKGSKGIAPDFFTFQNREWDLLEKERGITGDETRPAANRAVGTKDMT